MLYSNVHLPRLPQVPKLVKYSYFISLHIFALVGLIFVGVFFAIRLKLTNVSGTVDNLNTAFETQAHATQVLGISTSQPGDLPTNDSQLDSIDLQIAKLSQSRQQKITSLCTLEELSYIAPKNVAQILLVKQKANSENLASRMIFAVTTHLSNQEEFQNSVKNCIRTFDPDTITDSLIAARVQGTSSENIFYWPDQKEWSDVAASIAKDKEAIDKAAATVNLEPRILVSSLMVEQLRLFYSQRELYKKYFEPLKMLANSNKISLGVMAIKEDTAIAVENHLRDSSSPYYLGPEYEHLLDYAPEQNQSETRYARLTDNGHNHYWNYLYGAIYIKQMMKQWQDAGFSINDRPEIIATLFNVGFPQSNPNANPKVGGSTVHIGDTTYSFGRLAYEFYYSGEMLDNFPYMGSF